MYRSSPRRGEQQVNKKRLQSSPYPRRVRPLGGALDLPAQPEVGYLAHELSVD